MLLQSSRPLGHAAFRTLDIDEHEPLENVFRTWQSAAAHWQVGRKDLAEPIRHEHGGRRSSRSVRRAHCAMDVPPVVQERRKPLRAMLCSDLRGCHNNKYL